MRLVQRITRCKGSAHRYVVWVNGVARVVQTSKKGCGFGLAELMKAFFGYLSPKEDLSSPLLKVERAKAPPKEDVIQLEYLREYRSPFLPIEISQSSVVFLNDYRLTKTIAASVLTAISSGLFIENAIALPTGAESVIGDIKFQTKGSTLDISTKADRAIARYSTFNIAQHETVNFNLPSRSSQILNFIGDQNPSQVLGKLNSNGIVYLVNPNGLFFGQNAQVNVAGIVGSTLNINQSNFLNGNLIFEKNQSSLGKIENQGIINLQNNGAALFLGNQIENKGTITGNNAQIGFYSGNKITVGLNTDNSITADVSINTGTETSVTNGINNTGLISTTGGEITLQAKQKQNIYNQLINNSGVIEAKGISTNSGTIEILAENGATTNTGILDVSNTTGKGGTIHVLGDAVALDGNALVNANGQTGGGTILIGGDYQGNNPNIKNADYTYVGHNTQLKADATATGNGGKVVVWADDSTWYYGDISAKGNQGDGGLAEVSGKETLYFYGSANLTSQHGERGTLLLDPDNIYIMSPTLWLDASQLTGYTNGQAVSSWTDMSGNGINLTSSAAQRPIYVSSGQNNLPTIRFDGVDDILFGYVGSTLASSHTVILMVKPQVATSSYSPLFGYTNSTNSTNGGNTIYFRSDGQLASYPAYNSGGNLDPFGSWSVNSPYIVSLPLQLGSTNSVYINGSSSSLLGTTSSIPAHDYINLSQQGGISRFYNGDISEVLLLNRAVSSQERVMIEQYMGNKYGVSVASGSSNTSVMTQSQLETLSQTANISLSATKDITIGKLNGGLLNLQGSASLTLTADSDLNGTGAVTMIDNTNTLRTTGGAINITGSRLSLGNLDTRGASGTLSGNINLTALNNGISAGNIYTGGGTLTQTSASNFALNSVNTNGGSITLNALGNFYLMSPTLWLDANQILGVLSGGVVSSWQDLSGNSYTVNQGVVGQQPILVNNVINGQSALYFDGVNDFLQSNYYRAPSDQTYFGVVNYNSLTGPGGYALTGLQQPGSYLYFGVEGSTQKAYAYFGNNTGITNFGSTLSTNTPYLYGLTGIQGGNASLYLNGNLLASGAATYGNTSTLAFQVGRVNGGGHNVNGYIPEIAVFDSVLSVSERGLVDQYLGSKYGVTIPSSAVTSVATQSQIQNLSLQGNVTINAKNDITVGKLNGGVLNMQGTSSLTLTADSDSNGSGSVTMINMADRLRTEGRNISINTGSAATVGNIDTRGILADKTTGNISVTASSLSTGDIWVNSINTPSGNITLNHNGSTNRNITVNNTLSAAGNIDIRTRGNVTINGDLNHTAGANSSVSLIAGYTTNNSYYYANQSILDITGNINITNNVLKSVTFLSGDNSIFSKSYFNTPGASYGSVNFATGENLTNWVWGSNIGSGWTTPTLRLATNGSNSDITMNSGFNGSNLYLWAYGTGSDIVSGTGVHGTGNLTSSGDLDLYTAYGNIDVYGDFNSTGTSGLTRLNTAQTQAPMYTWANYGPSAGSTSKVNVTGDLNITQGTSKYLFVWTGGTNIASSIFSKPFFNQDLSFAGMTLATSGNNMPLALNYNLNAGSQGVFIHTAGSNSDITQLPGKLITSLGQVYLASSSTSYIGTLLNPIALSTNYLSAGGFSTPAGVYVSELDDVTLYYSPHSGGTPQSVSGDYYLRANGNITVSNNQSISSTGLGGNITLIADADGNNAGILTTNASITANNGTVTLKAAQMDINQAVNAGTTGTVNIQASTSKAINLSGTTVDNDSGLTLDLSAFELRQIRAANLNIGDLSVANNITLAGNLDLSGRLGLDGGGYNLTLNTQGNFDANSYQMQLGRDALWFDGSDDWVNFGNSPNFQVNNGTILAWVRTPDAGSAWRGVVTKQSAYGLFLFNNLVDTYDWSTSSNRPSAAAANDSNWNLVAFTFQSGVSNGSQLWLNGTSVLSTSISVSNQLVPLVAGAGSSSSSQIFSGQIDDIRMYNTVLSASEIQAIYNNGAGTTINSSLTGLVSGYNFSEGSGTSALDIKASNTGTLMNSPTWVRAKDLSVNSGGNITLGKTLSDGGNVVLNAVGNVNLNGLVGLTGDGNLNITSTGINKAVTVNNAVVANNINITTSGSGSDINLANTLTATGSVSAIVLNSADDINNSYGAGVLTTPNGRWLTNTYERADLINVPLEGFKRYNCVYGGSCPASYPGSGNGALFRIAPVLTVTADNQTREYGDANPTLTGTITGYIDGDTGSVLTGSASYSTTATSTSNVGSYIISSGLGSLSNSLGYQFSVPVDGTLNITKATLTATADNKTKEYGDVNPTLTITYTGFKNSETISVIDTLGTASTATNNTSNVGSYTITGSGATDNNYNFNYVNGVLNITKATLTATADNKTREYGDANPLLTMTYTGFKNSENNLVIDTLGTASTVADNMSNVGSYAITGSGATDNNYNFNYVDGVFNITKATLTATIDNKSRFYGSSNPLFTATYSGFKNAETSSVIDTLPILSTTASSGSQPGKYAISGNGGLDNNYNFTYVSGELTIEGISEPEVIPFITNPVQNFGVTRGSNDIIYSSEKTEDTSNPEKLFIPEIDTSAVENNSNLNSQIDISELNLSLK